MFRCALGQDSHRFEAADSSKPCVLGGVVIPGCPGLQGNSDADVVLHALTNAISGISGENILGPVADAMCRDQGITDSREYLKVALSTLRGLRIAHISISIEAARPRLAPHIPTLKKTIADLVGLTASDVGITATSGEGLTAFGRGEGIQAFVIVTAWPVSGSSTVPGEPV